MGEVIARNERAHPGGCGVKSALQQEHFDSTGLASALMCARLAGMLRGERPVVRRKASRRWHGFRRTEPQTGGPTAHADA